jgi:hypothetical protein
VGDFEREVLGIEQRAFEQPSPADRRRKAHHPFRDVHDNLVLAANIVAYCREVLVRR